MTIQRARTWIIVSSLIATGLVFVFFLVAPPLGYPLEWDQTQRVIEILLPVFLGYLASATHFLFHAGGGGDLTLGSRKAHLGIMIKGPIIVFAFACAAILWAFGYSNRAEGIQGEGMSVDQLAWAFTAALGVLSASTSVSASYLFALSDKASAERVAAVTGT